MMRSVLKSNLEPMRLKRSPMAKIIMALFRTLNHTFVVNSKRHHSTHLVHLVLPTKCQGNGGSHDEKEPWKHEIAHPYTVPKVLVELLVNVCEISLIIHENHANHRDTTKHVQREEPRVT